MCAARRPTRLRDTLTVRFARSAGATTQRARLNFPISRMRFPRVFIKALGQIKQSAARVNKELGVLDPKLADAIIDASQKARCPACVGATSALCVMPAALPLLAGD